MAQKKTNTLAPVSPPWIKPTVEYWLSRELSEIDSFLSAIRETADLLENKVENLRAFVAELPAGVASQKRADLTKAAGKKRKPKTLPGFKI